MAIHKHNQATAGVKAPDDVSKIAKDIGAEEIVFTAPKIYKSLIVTRFLALFIGVKNWCNLFRTIRNNAWVLLQHPNENIVIANKFIDICKKRKNTRFIILIHDLESLRKSTILNERNTLEERSNLADEVLLKKADHIICHNDMMKKYLISRGFDENVLVSLQIFDYLHNCTLPQKREKEKSVVIAGNLVENKCEYLYKLIDNMELNFRINLFGPNFIEKKKNPNVVYYGQCSPDELPEKLNGTFGLVWDGTKLEGCGGNMGEYIKFNNPHKCSLFLASNIPVIIWKEAAMAEFVLRNGVGIVVDSLLSIGEAIESISEEEYQNMLKNVKHVGDKLRSGYYLTRSLKIIMESNKEGENL